jgi:hypothetical protein
MYTDDTPEIRRAWWSELGMNRIVNHMTFRIHPQGFYLGCEHERNFVRICPPYRPPS